MHTICTINTTYNIYKIYHIFYLYCLHMHKYISISMLIFSIICYILLSFQCLCLLYSKLTTTSCGNPRNGNQLPFDMQAVGRGWSRNMSFCMSFCNSASIQVTPNEAGTRCLSAGAVCGREQ